MPQSCPRSQERIKRHTHLLRDLVGGLEADAVNLLRQEIGIGPDLFDGGFAVSLVNADRAAGAYAVGVEEDHDLADDLLFRPGFLDAAAPLRADAFDVLQSPRFVFDDVGDLLAE